MKLLQAATLKHPCEADPVWSTGKGSQDTSSTSEVKVKCRYPEERPRGENLKCHSSLSPLYLCGCGAKIINTAHPGASHWMALGFAPRKNPHPQLLPAPLVAPLLLPPGGGAHRAWEKRSIKGPEEGARHETPGTRTDLKTP